MNTTFNISGGPTLSANTPYWLVRYTTLDYRAINLSYSTATTGTGSGFVTGAPLFDARITLSLTSRKTPCTECNPIGYTYVGV